MKTLLVASDLTPLCDRAVARAFVLARSMDAKLIAAHALPATATHAEAADQRDRLHRFCLSIKQADQVSFLTKTPRGDDAAESIIALARESGAEMIVMGLHAPRLLDGLRQTTMEQVLGNSHLPVLLVRDPADHPYDSLLAAVDFSDSATLALRAGRKLLEGNHIRMLHAVHLPYQTGFSAGVAGEPPVMVDPTPFLAAARDDSQRWMAIQGIDAPPEVTIVQGPLEDRLRAAVADTPPDLMTLGAHAGHGPLDRLLGSAVADLLRAPPCDLLIARA